MERTKVVRGLRIAWTVFWGIGCVLLVVLWVRSYKNPVGLVRAIGIAWSSEDGALSLSYPASIWSDPHEVDFQVSYVMPAAKPVSLDWMVDSYGFRFWGSWSIWTAVISYVYLIVVFGVLASAPWLHFSFSLRTLLIATMLIAVVLGLVVSAT